MPPASRAARAEVLIAVMDNGRRPLESSAAWAPDRKIATPTDDLLPAGRNIPNVSSVVIGHKGARTGKNPDARE